MAQKPSKINKVTVELSDEEVDILKRLADSDGVSASAILRKAIYMMAELSQYEKERGELIITNQREISNIRAGGAVKGVSIDIRRQQG